MRPLSPFIAWRYMRVRGKGSAVGAISAVAVAGVAVATAAIICVLSVFNGFRDVLTERDNIMTPDVMVTPSKGKVIADADSMAKALSALPGVEMAIPVMADNALAIYEGGEMPVDLKGVPIEKYASMTSVPEIILDGGHYPASAVNSCAVSIGVASSLRMPEPGSRFLLFAPKRHGRVNMANPLSSFMMDTVTSAGIFRTDRAETDERTVICDISLARRIFQYTTEGSAVEVKGTPGQDPEALASEIARATGPGYEVKDRFRQQEINFRMINIEKWVSFLLLFFILVIASFNIISTLCMVVIEKRRSISTLRALGMSKSTIGAIFGWESIFVAIAGGIAGIAVGSLLCLAQQRWGFIHLAGDPSEMIVTAYPVSLQATDILLTLIPVVAAGLLTAWTASGFAKSRA